MSFRRFVNLVSSDGLKSVYALRRIDMSRFFLPTAAAAAAAANGTMMMKQQQRRQDSALLGPVINFCSRFFPTATNGTMKQQQQDSALPLPDPVINFYSPEDVNGSGGDMDFMLVDDDKVVAVDGTGGAFIYDTGKLAVRSLPRSHALFKAKFTTSLTVGSDLYVIDNLTNGTGTRNFEALVYTGQPQARQGNWHWRALPPPPPPPGVQDQDNDRTNIESCAAFADGSHIWMSASSRGRGRPDAIMQSCTHLFDTKGLVWSKEPADWVLPFTGSAQHVPELQNLWFGISSRDHGRAFCAVDLATASPSQPPVMRNVFDDGISAGVPEEGRHLMMAHAVHLGSGRFCITRFFSVLKKPDDGRSYDGLYSHLNCDDELFVVVAGVEVVSHGDGELILVKHRSERYMILDYELHWLL